MRQELWPISRSIRPDWEPRYELGVDRTAGSPAGISPGWRARRVEGEAIGHLVGWDGDMDRPRGAARVDARAINPAGPPGSASRV